jgi:hypothetical protein
MLSRKCLYSNLPVVIGGDFNLIRQANEKNTRNINQTLMDKFNMFIDLHQLQELRRSGPKYTWTNKKMNPVMVTLDRIFMSTEWEARFPLCSAWSKTRVGSDHCPIILDSRDKEDRSPRYFYFEKQWIMEEGFEEMVVGNWCSNRGRFNAQRYSLDVWYGCISLLRQHMRGWNANKRSEARKMKELCKRLSE